LLLLRRLILLTFNNGDPSVIRRLGGDPGGVFDG